MQSKEDTNTASSTLSTIDFIDLTKESPASRVIQFHKRRTMVSGENESTSHDKSERSTHRRVQTRRMTHSNPTFVSHLPYRTHFARSRTFERKQCCRNAYVRFHFLRLSHDIDQCLCRQSVRASKNSKSRGNNAASTDEIVTLEETVCVEDDDVHYATEADNGEPIPLMCPICYELLNSKLKPTTTRCGHIFCTPCLEAFLRTSKKCPTCNANVTLKSCTRLFL